MTSDNRYTLDRVAQEVRRAVGGEWVAGVHGSAPASIIAVHCTMDIQYSASQCRLSQLQGSSL